MPAFDAVTTTFGTAGTGGFGIRNSSMAEYSPYLQWVVAIFMALSASTSIYTFCSIKKWKQALRSEELRTYFIILAAASGIIFWNTYIPGENIEASLRHAAFQVFLDYDDDRALPPAILPAGRCFPKQPRAAEFIGAVPAVPAAD